MASIRHLAASDTTDSGGGDDALATWDVFQSDRLEVERALSTEAVRAALARGDLRADDLIRPAGTTVPGRGWPTCPP